SSWKVTLLFMWIEFADRYVPDRKRMTPPSGPLALALVIHRLIAAVSLVDPLPAAPQSLRTSSIRVAADAGPAETMPATVRGATAAVASHALGDLAIRFSTFPDTRVSLRPYGDRPGTRLQSSANVFYGRFDQARSAVSRQSSGRHRC